MDLTGVGLTLTLVIDVRVAFFFFFSSCFSFGSSLFSSAPVFSRPASAAIGFANISSSSVVGFVAASGVGCAASDACA